MDRRRLLTLAIVALSALARPAEAATITVIERGTSYVPKQVEVGVSDTVIWMFESAPAGAPNHTVTFDDGTDLNNNCPAVLLNNCQKNPGDKVQRTFTRVGTYPYYCKIHGGAGGQGMAGVVIVAPASNTTGPDGSTTTTTLRAGTTTTTPKATSSTTSTTRVLATSSTVVKSTTTTSDTTNALLPGDPPPFSGDDPNSSAAGQSGGSNDDGSDSTTVTVIVGLLLAVSAGGGFLLWRLRPGRA